MPTIQEALDDLVAETTSLTNTVSGRITDMDGKITQANSAQVAAETAKTNAQIAETSAQTAQTLAEGARDIANTAKTDAQTAKSDAQTAESAALSAQTAAEAAKTASIAADVSASTHRSDSQTAKNASVVARTGAETAETGAASSASSANSHKIKAGQWADNDEDATVETGKYSAKHWSAKAALEKSAAASSAGNALASKNAAATSEGVATTKASAASASATASASSASTATTKAAAASSSATAASGSASTATTKASDAAGSASNAASSASSAASAATTAVNAVIDTAPANLNTLNELAAALGDDANYAATTTTALGNRYTKSETDAKIVSLSPPATQAHVDSLGVNAAKLQGYTTSSQTPGNSIVRTGTSGNITLVNPEEYTGSIRLGAAWDRGGIYSNKTISISTEPGNNIDFVVGNAVKASISDAGTLSIAGHLIGNVSNTTELGSYSGGGIKRIRMTQGGELHFGDTTTTNFLGLTEGTVDNFGDQDRLGLYFRNELKMYSTSNTLRLTLDGDGNVTATGSIKLGDDTRTAATAGAGTLRWNSNKLQSSDGMTWEDVNYIPPIGTESNPASSGKILLDSGYPSGRYWIQPPGEAAKNTYVENDHEGGGWVMIKSRTQSTGAGGAHTGYGTAGTVEQYPNSWVLPQTFGKAIAGGASGANPSSGYEVLYYITNNSDLTWDGHSDNNWSFFEANNSIWNTNVGGHAHTVRRGYVRGHHVNAYYSGGPLWWQYNGATENHSDVSNIPGGPGSEDSFGYNTLDASHWTGSQYVVVLVRKKV